MTISDIKFRRSLTDGTLKAIASLTIDGFIAIHEIKVIQTDHLFVAMPSRKDESGNYHDIVHPINDRARWGRQWFAMKIVAKVIFFLQREIA